MRTQSFGTAIIFLVLAGCGGSFLRETEATKHGFSDGLSATFIAMLVVSVLSGVIIESVAWRVDGPLQHWMRSMVFASFAGFGFLMGSDALLWVSLATEASCLVVICALAYGLHAMLFWRYIVGAEVDRVDEKKMI